jgi:hypothetical protein
MSISKLLFTYNQTNELLNQEDDTGNNNKEDDDILQ